MFILASSKPFITPFLLDATFVSAIGGPCTVRHVSLRVHRVHWQPKYQILLYDGKYSGMSTNV